MMVNYIDPEKFASALVSSTNFEYSQTSIASGKINVDKALKTYIEAIDKAKKFNEEYSKKLDELNSQEIHDGLEILNNLKF